jgi:menaquinone-dependent protoporphyrinogen IX oxidase
VRFKPTNVRNKSLIGSVSIRWLIVRVDDMSENRTLIAYATHGGTTEKYAKAVASVLVDEFKMQVEVVNLRTDPNPDLTPYRHVIVGAGIQKFRVYEEGAAFLKQTKFGDRTVVIFVSALMPRDHVIEKYIDVIIQKNPQLKPLAVEVLGGRLKVLGRTITDKTDLDKAKTWARNIAEQLQAS